MFFAVRDFEDLVDGLNVEVEPLGVSKLEDLASDSLDGRGTFLWDLLGDMGDVGDFGDLGDRVTLSAPIPLVLAMLLEAGVLVDLSLITGADKSGLLGLFGLGSTGKLERLLGPFFTCSGYLKGLVLGTTCDCWSGGVHWEGERVVGEKERERGCGCWPLLLMPVLKEAGRVVTDFLDPTPGLVR